MGGVSCAWRREPGPESRCSMASWFEQRRFVQPRAAVVALVVSAWVVLAGGPLRADDAPMQPTTEGLVPGMPGTTVRMATENVDINVNERDGGVHAIVSA